MDLVQAKNTSKRSTTPVATEKNNQCGIVEEDLEARVQISCKLDLVGDLQPELVLADALQVLRRRYLRRANSLESTIPETDLHQCRQPVMYRCSRRERGGRRWQAYSSHAALEPVGVGGARGGAADEPEALERAPGPGPRPVEEASLDPGSPRRRTHRYMCAVMKDSLSDTSVWSSAR